MCLCRTAEKVLTALAATSGQNAMKSAEKLRRALKPSHSSTGFPAPRERSAEWRIARLFGKNSRWLGPAADVPPLPQANQAGGRTGSFRRQRFALPPAKLEPRLYNTLPGPVKLSFPARVWKLENPSPWHSTSNMHKVDLQKGRKAYDNSSRRRPVIPHRARQPCSVLLVPQPVRVDHALSA